MCKLRRIDKSYRKQGIMKKIIYWIFRNWCLQYRSDKTIRVISPVHHKLGDIVEIEIVKDDPYITEYIGNDWYYIIG